MLVGGGRAPHLVVCRRNGRRRCATRHTALIVGGSGAVGRLLSRHLSGLGYDVVVTSRRDRSHTDTDPGAVRRVVSDVTDATDLANVMASIDAEDGPIGLVVHAVGVAASLAPVTLTAGIYEAARAHIDSKLTVAQNIHRAVSALNEARRPAVVLCMSSATGMLGGIGMGPYAAATSSRRTQWVSAVWDGWRPDLEPSDAGSTIVMSGALGADTGLAAFDRILGLARTGRCPSVVTVSTSGLDARSRAASVPRKRTAASADPSALTDTQKAVAEI